SRTQEAIAGWYESLSRFSLGTGWHRPFTVPRISHAASADTVGKRLCACSTWNTRSAILFHVEHLCGKMWPQSAQSLIDSTQSRDFFVAPKYVIAIASGFGLF